METKICTKCKVEKEVNSFQFYHNRYQSWCRQCKNKGVRSYKSKNLEETKKKHREGYRRRKGVTGEYARGERHSRAKLEEKQIFEILWLYFAVGLSQSYIGNRFKISKYTVSSIVTRKSWKHLNIEELLKDAAVYRKKKNKITL